MNQDTVSYIEKLRLSSRKHKSILCVGLDPLPEVYPFSELPPSERIVKTFERLFDQMSRRNLIPGAFKPNIGYYHRLDRPLEGDFSGSRALAAILKLLGEAFPETPVILDAKRGDIATSSANYAEEAFACWMADAVTVAPYMGSDSTGPFLKWSNQGRGVYILNRTSNPGGKELQNLSVHGPAISPDTHPDAHPDTQAKEQTEKPSSGLRNRPLYLEVAEAIARAAKSAPGTGAVVGATNPKELEDLAVFYSNYSDMSIPLLIPGVGGQGGSAKLTVSSLRNAGYPLEQVRINSSSGITHPWAKQKQAPPTDWEQVCIDAFARLTEETGYAG